LLSKRVDLCRYATVRWERMVKDKAAGKKIVTDPRKV
jgi:hypothetical protein